MPIPPEPCRAGAFLLESPIARGGMGQVWLARHHTRPLRAAVKVMRHTGDHPDDLLESELRATATLDHPSIVRLYDTGLLDTGADAHEGLSVGQPWIAMELLAGGTLMDHPTTSGAATLDTVCTLLDALAHAHARGVVHRDLKPQNVLFDDHGRPILVDFGIATVRAPGQISAAGSRSAGTPRWMAPEQFLEEPTGPWTDLYGLGALAWWMVTGRPVFETRGRWKLARAHLRQAPPPLQPRFEMPDGLEDWLRRMLAKDPDDRYRSAAEAAHALRALPESDPGPPPLPADVDAGMAMPRPLEAQLRGLSLVRVRELPLVGRRPEQNQLWSALRSAIEHRQSRMILVEGPRGVGTSRLAAWLCRRAHELGVCEVHDGPDALTRLPDGARPRVLWVDDADPSQLGAVPTALAHPGTLAIVTVRDERTDDALEDALRALRVDPRCERIRLGSLSPEARKALVDQLGDFDPALRQQLVVRSAGNPAFAISLVDDWATRGLLTSGPRGLTLRPGADTLLPDSLAQVWLQRVESVLEGQPASWRTALRAAAFLGMSVDPGEWPAVCAELGLQVPRGLVVRLLVDGLASQEDAHRGMRWRFSQGETRDAIVAQATRAGDSAAIHRACVAVLQRGDGLAWRRSAEHLVALGDIEGAVIALTEVTDSVIGDDVPLGSTLIERARLLAQRLPPNHPAHARVEMGTSAMYLELGHLESAISHAQRAVQAAEEADDPTLLGRSVYVLSAALGDAGRGAESVHHAERAVTLLEAAGAPQRYLAQAWLRVALGRLMLARRAEALDAADHHLALATNEDQRLEGCALRALILAESGELDAARAQLDAERVNPTLDHNKLRSLHLYVESFVLRAADDLAGAEQALASAIEARFSQGGRPEDWSATHLDLLLAMGRTDDAHRVADLIGPARGFEGRTALALYAATVGRFEDAERHLLGALTLSYDAAFPYVADRVERLGDLALAAGRVRLASVALSEASAEWRRCGDAVRATIIADRTPALEVTATLGHQELRDPIGPSDRVWVGTDRRTGHATRITILPEADDIEERRARIAAALAHPAMLAVVESGVVTDSEAALGIGHLPAGVAWIATADPGPPRPLQLDSFGALQATLLELLDALAHLHATGHLHLALHPDSVQRMPTGRATLVDAAEALVSPAAHRRTPRWLAPEQLTRSQERVGPPTDLYVLGLLAWHWVCGAPLQDTDNPWRLLRLQQEPLPSLAPRMTVPPELEAWLRRLLEPISARRFQRAAHAADVLRELGTERDDTGPVAPPLITLEPGLTDETPSAAPGPRPGDGGPPAWLGGSLEDFGHERAALWTSLRQARAGTARAAVLAAPRHLTERLVRWLTYSADARGLGHVLGPPPADGSDAARAIATEVLGVADLSETEVVECLARSAVPQAERVSSWILGRLDPGAEGPDLLSRVLRHAVVPPLVPVVVLGDLDVPGTRDLMRGLLRADLGMLVVAGASTAQRTDDEDGVLRIPVVDVQAENRSLAGRTHARWRRAVQRMIVEAPDTWAPALAAAAFVGQPVDSARWRRVLGDLQRSVPPGLNRALYASGIAVPEIRGLSPGWSWAHPAARGAAVRLAGELEPRIHAACAAALAEEGPAAAERRASHLEAAGQRTEAIETLLVARRWLSSRDYPRELRVITHAEQLLEGLDEPALAIRVALARGAHAVRVQDVDGALEVASSAIARASALADPVLEARARSLRGRCRWLTGDKAGATTDLLHATRALRSAGDRDALTVALSDLAGIYGTQLQFVAAEEAAREAAATAATSSQRCEVLCVLGAVLIQSGRADEGLTLLQRIRPEVMAEAVVHTQALWHFLHSGSLVAVGDLQGAEDSVRTALARRATLGVENSSWVIELAAIRLDRGYPEDARLLLRQIREAPSRPTVESVTLVAHLAALDGAWEEVAQALAPRRSHSIDALHRWEKVATLATGAGHHTLARRILEWVTTRWTARQRESDRARTEALLERLP